MGMNDYTKASAINLYSTQKLYVELCLLAFKCLNHRWNETCKHAISVERIGALDKVNINSSHTPLCWYAVQRLYSEFQNWQGSIRFACKNIGVVICAV